MSTPLHHAILAGALCFLLTSGAAVALPVVTAQSWLIADNSGKVIEGVNTTDIRSIASISKLMTAMVVLDAKQPLDEILYLRKLPITRLQAIELSVIKSDNEASTLLCNSYIYGYYACIRAMNAKATALNMLNTRFIEPTGLSIFNVSTAEELIKLVSAASKYPEIVKASNTEIIKLKVVTKNKTTWQQFRNTNPMVGKGLDYIISKTGFINKSGGCIVVMINTVNGVRTVVLLGSKNTKTRIPEAQLIMSSF